MAKPGPQRIALDRAQVERLATLGATVEEIASFFGCSKRTLEKNFSAPIKKGRHMRKVALRQMQWESAKKGNVAMLIWLGKQELGQKDKPEDSGDNDKPLPWVD